MQTFLAKYTSLDEIRSYVGQAARNANLNDKAVYAIQLAVDEACTNIIDYAYGGESDKEIKLDCEITADALLITIQDEGKPFDVSDVATPDVDLPLSERQVGGLGIFLINNLMDDVRHYPGEKIGNKLLLKKKRDPAIIEPRIPDWLKLTDLGEEMLDTRSLAAHRDRIAQMVSALIAGDVRIWLDESLFRLPNWDEAPIFSENPESALMHTAFERNGLVQAQEGDTSFVALPLKDHGFILGILEIARSAAKPFSQDEQDTLEGLVGIAALSLVAAHRVAVGHWRVGQLTLVRQVSTQLATVMDVDELAKRVTELIQKTFKYYYVAVFTVDAGHDVLHFRSSAGGAQNGATPRAPKLEIKLGEGLIGSVAQTGEEVVCGDVDAEPRFRFLAALPETKSEIVLPLIVDDRKLGVLDIQHDRFNAFHPNDLLVLHALADNVALAIEGARIYDSLLRRAEQMDVIAEVSRKATRSLELTELMADVAGLITERFGYPYVHLFTVHHNRRRINYEAGSGMHKDALAGYSLSLDDPAGLVPWVARNKESVLANDVSLEPRYRPSSLPPENTRSEIVVPLVFDGEAKGILDVQSDRLDAFSREDQLLFEALGDNIAVAIHNADLYRSERWRRQVADSLREVAGLLSDNANLEKVFNAILTELERSLPSEVAALWLLRDEGDLYLAAVHGLDYVTLREARATSADASIALARALLSHEPIIRKSDDVIGPVGLAAGYDKETYSSIAAPLHIGEQPVGVLTLSHHGAGRYGHEARAITSTFASYAAVAIENARLYDSSQEQAYASAALLQVAQAVASTNVLDEILTAIIRVMPILVGVDRCALYLWDETAQQYTVSQQYGLSEEDQFLVWGDIFEPGEFPLLDGVRETNTTLLRRYVVGSRPVSWLDLSPPWEEGAEFISSEYDLFMAVPLKIKDDLYGILLAEEAPGGLRFRERRLEIINGIAQQAALSIQNDRFRREMVARERLEHEVQVAREIQKTFIPELLPDVSGWAFAGRWQTARQVGGDFYDLIELDDDRLGFFIADVADKGIPAALFMSLTRTLVRAAVKDTDCPATALKRVNDLLIPDTQQGMFVTAVYGVLSPKTGEFVYANAGHNPPLWLKADGSIERLTRTGMALGVLEGTSMEKRTIQINAGDTLLLYTDGLTEAFSPDNELFGETRLQEALRATTGDLDTSLNEIEAKLKKFMSTMPAADDLTMLAVRHISA
jgi:sigma-B regulation protein RsbU (phosphoserine phosphatase)